MMDLIEWDLDVRYRCQLLSSLSSIRLVACNECFPFEFDLVPNL